jgi:hypothetical protein
LKKRLVQDERNAQATIKRKKSNAHLFTRSRNPVKPEEAGAGSDAATGRFFLKVFFISVLIRDITRLTNTNEINNVTSRKVTPSPNPLPSGERIKEGKAVTNLNAFVLEL